jgi:hypothetical protein
MPSIRAWRKAFKAVSGMPDDNISRLIPRSGHVVQMPDGAASPSREEPKLLRVPTQFHTVDEALNCALKMDLPNVIILSEKADGALVFLSDDLATLASTNWLLDRMKKLLMQPDHFARRDGKEPA